MNSYLDYPVCSRGANIFGAKAGYPNLNHGYAPSSSCATSDSYAGDGRLAAAASAPLQTQSVPLHQQTHVNLDLQFPAAGMYGSPLEYGHHQYGLVPDQDRGFIHAQVSPLGSSMAPVYAGEGCAPAAAPGAQYLPFGGGDQRQQEYPEGVYARLPAPCKEKELELVEETSKTFDWMKVKRNPPKTGLLWKKCAVTDSSRGADVRQYVRKTHTS